MDNFADEDLDELSVDEKKIATLYLLISDMAKFLSELSVPIRRFLDKKELDDLLKRADEVK